MAMWSIGELLADFSDSKNPAISLRELWQECQLSLVFVLFVFLTVLIHNFLYSGYLYNQLNSLKRDFNSEDRPYFSARFDPKEGYPYFNKTCLGLSARCFSMVFDFVAVAFSISAFYYILVWCF